MAAMRDMGLAVLVLLCHGAVAEVFKCIDETGGVSYRDTDCGFAESADAIDRRFSNSLPMGLPEDQAAMIEEVAKEARTRRQVHIDERDAYIRRRNEAIHAKRSECLNLREELADLRASNRSNTSNTDGEARLTYAMRKACST